MGDLNKYGARPRCVTASSVILQRLRNLLLPFPLEGSDRQLHPDEAHAQAEAARSLSARLFAERLRADMLVLRSLNVVWCEL